MRKVILSGMIGNGLEWYDYAIYGHLAVVIGNLFFPESDPTTKLLSTYGVFAVGFIARPFGGLIFGWIGDHFGRRRALSISVLLMAASTGLIGLMPTYSQIGVAAPMLLVLIRIVQGLSIGGEFSGAITYMVEHSPPGKRGIVGSAAMISLVLGFLTGSMVATFIAYALPQTDFERWGWRLPFLAGIAIGLVGFYIRHHCEESPAYLEAKATGALSKTPVREAFKLHPRAMLKAIGIYFLVTMPFYMVTVYFIGFNKGLGLTIQDALTINMLCMLAMLFAVPLSAWWSDRVGRRPVLLIIAAYFFCLSYPLFLWFDPGSLMALTLAQLAFAVMVGLFIGPVPAVLAELFPTGVRYTGMAVSYNIAAALFGGTAPMVGVWLTKHFGGEAVAGYIMLSAVAGAVAVHYFNDRHREALP